MGGGVHRHPGRTLSIISIEFLLSSGLENYEIPTLIGFEQHGKNNKKDYIMTCSLSWIPIHFLAIELMGVQDLGLLRTWYRDGDGRTDGRYAV